MQEEGELEEQEKKPKRAANADVTTDEEGFATFELDTFSVETEWISWLPPGSPKGRVPFEAEIMPNAISPEDLSEYRKALRDVRAQDIRIGQLDKVLNTFEEGDPEYQDALEELKGDGEENPGIENHQDEMDMNITYIWFPAITRTNAVKGGKPIDVTQKNPEARKHIRELFGVTAVNGICTVIIQRINNKITGKARRERRRKGKGSSKRG